MSYTCIILFENDIEHMIYIYSRYPTMIWILLECILLYITKELETSFNNLHVLLMHKTIYSCHVN